MAAAAAVIVRQRVVTLSCVTCPSVGSYFSSGLGCAAATRGCGSSTGASTGAASIAQRPEHYTGSPAAISFNDAKATSVAAARKALTPECAAFVYEPVIQPNARDIEVPYRRLEGLEAGVHLEPLRDGREMLHVDAWVFTALAKEAMTDVNHLFRPGHLSQLQKILDDPEASANDRLVGRELLKNAVVAAGRRLPSCQDTGTATVVANRGHLVLTDGQDAEHLSRGIYEAYTEGNLRYSQMAPFGMFKEQNTRNNLPAQIDLSLGSGSSYDFLFIACPPYHLSVVVGGLSPDMTMKAVKLLAAKQLDGLPLEGSGAGRAIRDVEWEEKIHNLCRDMGIGAQFGGKYFVHDVRVARLPRHGGSCPVGIGVSCSADRQAQARITADGVFLEELEREPEKYLQVDETQLSSEVHRIDLNANPRAELTKLPVATRVMLTGTMLVARDIAHAQFQTILDRGEDLPKYLLDHPLFYAGPSKTPDGLPSGSFGPTSAVRMDPYVPVLQRRGGSLIMIGKGNRTKEVTKACKQFGGFYLGTIGGMAAQLTSECVKSVEILDMHELGMEAVFRIEVENFPAFIVVDDKGGDFFAKWR